MVTDPKQNQSKRVTPAQLLTRYHQKRDFNVTKEPKGNGDSTRLSGGNRYLIQKHDASHLHYDFRLELNGVLKSWAVPKGPSLNPQHKSLAIEVEDHPLEYGSFEGIIPKGQYGGGTVMLWDEGTWEPLDDPEKGYDAGKLQFKLHGKKLQGVWKLVRMRGDRSEAKPQWLLIKADDTYSSASLDVLKSADQSAKTGRVMEDIAGDGDAVWQSHKEGPDKTAAKSKPKRDTTHKPAMPRGILPQLASLVDHAPTGDNWLHEIKFDGYRILAYCQPNDVRLITRNQQDWTHKFIGVARSLSALKLDSAIVDGEIVALDPKGRSDFGALQEALKAGHAGTPILYAFDLLYLDGQDLRPRPLLERKEKLEQLLKGIDPNGNVRYSDHVRGDGGTIRDQACAMSLEGIISKTASAPYVSGRGAAWVKSKCMQRQEMVIVGFTDPMRSRKGFGALLLGYYDEAHHLLYAGRVGTGFDDALLQKLHRQLRGLERKDAPLDRPAPKREQRAAHWVEPSLVAEISFSNWTKDGMLRHPSFIALRSDKPAPEVTREIPLKTKETPKAKRKQSNKLGQTPTDQVGTSQNGTADSSSALSSLTHPEKVWYADKKITKQDIAKYYLSVQEWMLPHVINRPLTLLRCPSGTAAKCFFQRHWTESLPHAIAKAPSQEKESYIYIKDMDGLLALVQINALEIHTWNCSIDDMQHPDQLVFDLDPAPDVTWKMVIKGAQMLYAALKQLKLPAFLRTSGGKGLHLTIPIMPNVDWTQAKSFCEQVAKALVQQSDLFVANMRKDLRKGKIYIDYQRNGRSATAIAPYSTRARAGAAVSMPIAWEELASVKSADAFRIPATAYLQGRRQDPWAGIDASRVDLRRIAATS